MSIEEVRTMSAASPGRLRSFWNVMQGDATLMRRVNGWLTIFWVAMIPISLALGWLNSVAYVSALSLWALVSGHWAGWQAARVEVEQQRASEAERADPLEDRVERELVRDTQLERH